MRSFGFMLLLLGAILRFVEGGGLPIVGPLEPAPFEATGNRCLILHETARMSELPPEQLSIFQGERVREYLRAKCVEGPDGSPEFRIWDTSEGDLGFVPDLWKQAIEKAEAADGFALPWLVISNGRTGYSGPLPADEDAAIALLERFFE